MKTFKYTARTNNGVVVEDTIRGENQIDAINQLRNKGMFVTNIKEEKTSLSLTKKGISPKQLALFCKQMSFLLNSGITTYDSLNLLKDSSTSKEFTRCIEGLMRDVQDGKMLSQAMEAQKESFPDVVIHQVKSGENGAFIEKALNDVAMQIEKDLAFKSKLRTALIYPAVVILVTIVMVYYLTTNVVPSITEVLEDLGGDLPPMTRFVIAFSSIFNKTIPFQVAIVLGLIVAYKYFHAKPKTGVLIDKKKVNLKLVGPLIRKISIARFCRTLGSLLGNGVSITNSLSTSGSVMGNKYLASKIEEVRSNIAQDGWELSYALTQTNEFDSMITQLVTVGEETANLPEVLNIIADQIEEEVDDYIKTVMSYTEPVLIIIIGAVVGTVVVSMFLPMFSLLDQF